MTDAERAVIDAARAIAPLVEAVISGMYSDDRGVWRTGSLSLCELEDAAPAFLAAVRALPRPLSEQLAELRVGDVLGMPDDPTEYGVLCNHPPTRTVFVVWNGGECCAAFDHSVFDRIISRGENIRG